MTHRRSDQNPPSDEEGGPFNSPAEGGGQRAVDAWPGASPPSIQHEFANTLHSILIQVRCAEDAIAKEDLTAVRTNLAQIERAVAQSQQMLQELRHHLPRHAPGPEPGAPTD